MRSTGAFLLGSDFKALGVARSLGQRGVPVAVVDNLPRAAWFSRHVARRFRWEGPMSGPGFLAFLLDTACRGLEGWVLIPTQDETLELVARNHDALSGSFRLVTQPWNVLKWAHDKKLLHVIADGAGVAHPTTWYPESEDHLRTIEVRFPAILKPSISIDMQHATGRKAIAVDDVDELTDAYRRMRAVVPAEHLMVQELVARGTQVSVAAFCEGGRVVSAMTARRTRQYPIDFGLSSSFVEAVEMPYLLEIGARLLRRLAITGMVEVEFVEDPADATAKLLDVNVRPFGWHVLCIRCGLDLPWMQYEYTFGRHPHRTEPVYGPRWLRMLTDVPAAWQSMRAGAVTPRGYVRSLRGPRVFSVLDLHDPMPFAWDLFVAIKRVLRGDRPGRQALRGMSSSATLNPADPVRPGASVTG
jgi:predicted ATP-grasp superfamily ATP-dependent carboligase